MVHRFSTILKSLYTCLCLWYRVKFDSVCMFGIVLNRNFDLITEMRETSVRALIPLENDSHLSMCGLPGLLIGRDGTSYLDPENCDLTFEYLRNAGARALYLLMEDHELPPHTEEVVTACGKTYDIELMWLPIPDFSIPSSKAEEQWISDRDRRAKILGSGGGICLSCMHGAGRSGMMAAAVSAERGVEARKAVRFVRKHCADAVGSRQQELWVARGSYLG